MAFNKKLIADVPTTYMLRGKEIALSRDEVMVQSREKSRNVAYFLY